MGVISKMLIAEISRVYALFDGEIATMKIREIGATEGERLRNRLFSYIYAQLLLESGTTLVYKSQQAAFVMVPASRCSPTSRNVLWL